MVHPLEDQLLRLPPCLSQSELMESSQALLRPRRRDSLLMGPRQFSLWLRMGLAARDRRWDDFTFNARTSHSLMSKGCHLKTWSSLYMTSHICVTSTGLQRFAQDSVQPWPRVCIRALFNAIQWGAEPGKGLHSPARLSSSHPLGQNRAAGLTLTGAKWARIYGFAEAALSTVRHTNTGTPSPLAHRSFPTLGNKRRWIFPSDIITAMGSGRQTHSPGTDPTK